MTVSFPDMGDVLTLGACLSGNNPPAHESVVGTLLSRTVWAKVSPPPKASPPASLITTLIIATLRAICASPRLVTLGSTS